MGVVLVIPERIKGIGFSIVSNQNIPSQVSIPTCIACWTVCLSIDINSNVWIWINFELNDHDISTCSQVKWICRVIRSQEKGKAGTGINTVNGEREISAEVCLRPCWAVPKVHALCIDNDSFWWIRIIWVEFNCSVGSSSITFIGDFWSIVMTKISYLEGKWISKGM